VTEAAADVVPNLRAPAARLAAGFAARLEAERDRWALWIPVGFAAGVGGYFALEREPAAGLGAVVLALAVSAGAGGARRLRFRAPGLLSGPGRGRFRLRQAACRRAPRGVRRRVEPPRSRLISRIWWTRLRLVTSERILAALPGEPGAVAAASMTGARGAVLGRRSARKVEWLRRATKPI